MRRLALGLLVVLAAAGCTDNNTHVPDAGKDAPPLTQAALHLTPQSMDLGSANLGATTNATTFTVSNTGESVSGMISVLTSGVDASSFDVLTSCTRLAQAGTCVVTVTFTATSLGANAANLVVSASPGGTVMAMMSAVGVSAPQLIVSPTLFAFPDQALNTTGASQVFTVSNPAGVPTGALTVAAAGADPGQFVKSADSCSGLVLVPAATCTLTIAFHPTTSGAKSASFAIGANPGGFASASVVGNGLSAALLSISPTVRDFGSVVPCMGTMDSTFTLANTGDVATGALTTPVLGGTDAAQFAIVSETCAGMTLTPNSGNSCSVIVRFRTQVPGSRSATLSSTATPGGTAMAVLVGTGLSPGSLSINPSTADFGTVGTGAASAFTTFTVTTLCNTATAPLSTALFGANPGDFTIGQNTCQGAVLAASSCTIQVAFTPGTTDAKSASLSVANGGQVVSAALTGTGN